MTLSDITPVGGGKHLRISVTSGRYTVRCMKFGTTLEEFPYCVGDVLDLAVTLDAKEYNGKNTLSIYIKDMKLAGLNVEEVTSGWALYEKSRRNEVLTAEELNGLLPDRNEFAVIYRLLRSANGFHGSPEALLGHLSCPTVGIQKLLTALDVLEEHGLLLQERTGSCVNIVMKNVSQKVDLFDSKILSRLKSLEEEGEPYGMAAENI